jgi:hypothetical protein
MAIQDLAQLAVTEHNAAAHETVRAVAGDLLEALQQVGGEGSGAELTDKLVIVEGQELASLIDTTRDIEGSDDLADSLCGGRLVSEAKRSERWGLSWFVRHGMSLSRAM